MAVTLTNSQLSAGLYSAFWNRAPDATGQNFWVNKLNTGAVTPLEMANAAFAAPEGFAAYPASIRQDKTALVTQVYNSVFNRAPDAGGLAFWTAQLTADSLGNVTNFPQVVLNMMYSALNSAAAGNTDGMQFQNEISVGIFVAETLRTDDPAVTSVAFQGVTYEASSVAIREAQLAEMVAPVYTLTTNIDTINVTVAGLNNVQGGLQNNGKATETWNSGDTINGNGLTTVSLILNDGGAGTGSVVDANDVASINVNLVSNSTLENVEFTNVAAVNVTSGVAGQTLTANNASLSTVYGASVAGRNFVETINYAATTGTADLAQLAVVGTGNATTDTTFNVATGNTIEAVSLATAGTNYVTVNGGTGAKSFTITGTGTNDIEVGTANTSLTLDASGTTGANTLRVGTHLSGTADTVIGGSGADTLYATIANTTVSTISGVETLDLTFGATSTFNASRVTGVDTVKIDNSGTAATVSNLANTVDTVTFATSATGAGATVSYAAGTATDLTVNVGKTTTAGTSTQIVGIGGLTLANNAADVVINSVSDKAATINTTGALALGTATGLEINASAAVTAGGITGTKVTTEVLNATAGAITTGSFTAATSLADLTLNAIGAAVGIGTITTADALTSVALNATGGNVSTGLISVDDSLSTITIDSGAGAADYTTTTSFALSATAGAKAAVNGVLTVTGEGDTSVTTTDATTFIGSVDATQATGSVTLNFAAYTGASGYTINLGNAGTGETNSVSVAGTTGASVITGGTGADSIVGGNAADVLNSGSGNDSVTGEAGNDVVTLGAGLDLYTFADQIAVPLGTATHASKTEVVTNVGNDVLDSFVVADDTFVIDQTVFGTNIGNAGTHVLTHFENAATATTVLGAQASAVTGSIVVVQNVASAPADVYYIDGVINGTSDTVASLVVGGTATLIGTLSSVTGTVATGDFFVVA